VRWIVSVAGEREMTVKVSQYAGFCTGVRRAVEMALSAAQDGGNVFTLGELINNPPEVCRLASMGIKPVQCLDEISDGTVVIRSHGVSQDMLKACLDKKLRVVDCTCPYVARVHVMVREYSVEGKPVVLVGSKTHPEVLGTAGQCHGSVYIIKNNEDAQALPYLEEALLVAQTTFSPDEFWALKDTVTQKVKHLTVQNTLCAFVGKRLEEAAELAKQSDLMIVVGGKNSANTARLYDVCAGICTNTLWVESAAELPDRQSYTYPNRVGITAGGSTPDWSLKEVVALMDEMNMDNERVPSAEKDAKESFMADVEATLIKIRPGQTLLGKVVQITDDEVCVNIGYKSDGLIKKTDLSDGDIEIEDEIEVEVLKVNDGEGNVLLSQRNVVNKKVWAEIMEKFERNEYVEGVGKQAVKGGLVADVSGISCFIPASLLSQRFVDKISDFIGQTMQLKIIEADQQKKRIVASRKAVITEEAAKKKAEAWDKLHEGEIVQGIVRRLRDFGAFVDIGGVDGLIHVTDLSYGRIKHPSEVVSPDQVIEVKILSIDRERDRVQLGYKQLQPKPWDTIHEKYSEGDIVTGRVARIAAFGAFIELDRGLDGLVHISQCAPHRVMKVEDAVTVGSQVRVKILGIDTERKRISLSIREALEEEMPAGGEVLDANPLVYEEQADDIVKDVEPVSDEGVEDEPADTNKVLAEDEPVVEDSAVPITEDTEPAQHEAASEEPVVESHDPQEDEAAPDTSETVEL